MNERERYLAALQFKQPDRIPLNPGHGRQSTRARWHKEGLPAHVDNIAEYAYREAGGVKAWPKGGEGFLFNHRMMPQFEEKVLEKRARSQIVQDWKGNICEIGNEYTVRHLYEASDFVTRKWIRCPVEERADWEAMKLRYDPEEPARLPEDAVHRGKRLAHRDHPLCLNISGPFWQLREWLGFERLCMLFVDEPEWVSEMVKFWEDFIARLLERMLEHVVPDHVHFSEDMAFKAYPMISPDMTRRFLLPTYRRWDEILRKAGVPIHGIDSDGFIETLIPVWMDAGVNLCDPIEVAAHNDLPRMRKMFGARMAYCGGVDKRAMAAGGRTIEKEIERLRPIIEEGGYIPSCDHGVPSDVSWPNFVYYTKLLAKVTGWL